MKRPKSLALAALCLLLIAALRAAPVEVKIDAAKTGEAIEPFIYGQFIEHLGRCIYGGIWAEMLEDRKFHFPITAKYSPYRGIENPDFPGQFVTGEFPVVGASPWQIIGDPSAVTMVTEDAFVGRHSPRVNAGAGLRQLDLGVRAGLAYNGYIWAKPLSGRAEIQVTLVWGPAEADRATSVLAFEGDDFSKRTFSLTPALGSDKGAQLELRVSGGDVILGPPSLMPSDNVRGMRADTLALLKQLNGTVYRWPGGNFVSGYDWRDGIGDRDRRPPRKNPAWTGVEHNDFGTDEFIDFCREIETVPMIAVNTGLGDAYSAAQWVEYCNSGADTIGGSWRVKNGHADPFNVRYWCVGNEMWGPFQLGFMQLHHYVIKHNLVAEAMREVDPETILVGVGDILQINTKNDPVQAARGIPWSHGMLESCADHLDLLSEHFYRGRLPWDPTQVRVDVREHVTQIRDAIRQRADLHRQLQPKLANLEGRTVPISMDEWNYWHREYVYGELGCSYELQDGLGIAAGLHEFYRQSDIIKVATYAQTVNVIGAIKTTKTAAEMETTGLVLQLYREKFGQTPLTVTTSGADGSIDVMAALTSDGKTLTLGVVNPTAEPLDLKTDLTGLEPTGAATRWLITGPDAESRNAPGKPRVVDITHAPAAADALQAPALSVSLFEIPLE